MSTTFTIRTTKGKHTGSLAEVCAWQAEYQGGMATLHPNDSDLVSIDVDGVDFDPEDLEPSIEAVRELVTEAVGTYYIGDYDSEAGTRTLYRRSSFGGVVDLGGGERGWTTDEDLVALVQEVHAHGWMPVEIRDALLERVAAGSSRGVTL